MVNVTPQVSGQLLQVMFKQGDYVSKGDLLFQIDPRAYQVALDQALGNLQRDKAMLKQAQANLQKDIAQQGQVQPLAIKCGQVCQYRARPLSHAGGAGRHLHGATPADEHQCCDGRSGCGRHQSHRKCAGYFEADKAAIETAQGTIAADNASVETARIQLGFTQIRSPITGRTGSLNVYPGNVVSVSSGMTATPLVTIDQIQPIYVNFTVPEEYIDALRQAQPKRHTPGLYSHPGDKAQPLKARSPSLSTQSTPALVPSLCAPSLLTPTKNSFRSVYRGYSLHACRQALCAYPHCGCGDHTAGQRRL